MSTPQGPPPPPPSPGAGPPGEGAPYGYAPPPGFPPPGYGGYTEPMPSVPGYAQYGQPQGPVGQIRPTGMIILLFLVTFGIWASSTTSRPTRR